VQKLTDKMPIYINDLFCADIPTVYINIIILNEMKYLMALPLMAWLMPGQGSQ
jgi:hypothetical protein